MAKKEEEKKEYFNKVIKLPLHIKETLQIKAIKENVSFEEYLRLIILSDYENVKKNG